MVSKSRYSLFLTTVSRNTLEVLISRGADIRAYNREGFGVRLPVGTVSLRKTKHFPRRCEAVTIEGATTEYRLPDGTEIAYQRILREFQIGKVVVTTMVFVKSRQLELV